MQFNNKALECAKLVKLLILDVDGVLTDGGIYFDDNGSEFKRFNALDGHGIKMLRNFGVEIAIISARNTECVSHRIKNLGLEHYYPGQSNKSKAYKQLLLKLNMDSKHVAYVGDDVIDLPVMSKVALPIAVANAHEFVKEHAIAITNKSGGHGAIREVCDAILQAQDGYDGLMKEYLE